MGFTNPKKVCTWIGDFSIYEVTVGKVILFLCMVILKVIFIQLTLYLLQGNLQFTQIN